MTAPSSNLNVTDKDELKKIIMHKILSENNSKDVSESERNIINEILSQKHSADVPENNITELKDKEHKGHTVTQKVKSGFKIY